MAASTGLRMASDSPARAGRKSLDSSDRVEVQTHPSGFGTRTNPGGKACLEARGVAVHFEGVKAVDGVDLVLRPGEILGLIGPNGAGKTTFVERADRLPTFHSRTGLDRRRRRHWLASEPLARMGVARTFQSVRLFPNLTVMENAEVGAVGVGMGRREARSIARELLSRLGPRGRAHERASGLPHGDERRLGIVRSTRRSPAVLAPRRARRRP